MKYFLSILSMLIIPYALLAGEEKIKIDNIKSVTMTEYSSDIKGNKKQIKKQRVTDYDPEGRKIKEVFYGRSRRKVESETQYLYDDKGRLKERITSKARIMRTGRYEFLKSKRLYIYDDRGNLTLETDFDHTGKKTARTVKSYDSSGRMISFVNYMKGKNYGGQFITYNRKGQKIKVIITNSYGDRIWMKYIYNRKGNNTVIRSRTGKTINRFDKSNRLTKTLSYNRGKLESQYIYSYNKAGQQIKYIYKNSKKIISSNTYTYDDNGNLIERLDMINSWSRPGYTLVTWAYDIYEKAEKEEVKEEDNKKKQSGEI